MLQLASMSCGYGRSMVVHDVSLEVGARQVVALVGPNGAGKSTLAAALAGLLQTSAGTISLHGADMTRASTRERMESGLVLVPEGRRLFGRMSVRDNLLMGSVLPRARAKRRELLDGVFSTFPILADRQEQHARTLSGGEQQMLAVGRGLMADPQLLVLDEPGLGLAPVMVKQLYSVLSGLRDRDISVLLIDQSARQALGLADHAHIFDRGRSVAAGSPAQLQNQGDLIAHYFGEPEQSVPDHNGEPRTEAL